MFIYKWPVHWYQKGHWEHEDCSFRLRYHPIVGLEVIFSSKKWSRRTKTRSGPVQILRSDFLDPNLQYLIFWMYSTFLYFTTAVELYPLFQTSFRSNSTLFRAISTVVRAISTLYFDLGLIPHGTSDPFIIRSYSKLFLGLIPQYCIS